MELVFTDFLLGTHTFPDNIELGLMISVDLYGKTSQMLLEQHNIEIEKLLSCFQLLTALS